MIRYGVHGSALPGFSTSGVFSAIAGIHSECTPGELLGSTTPSVAARKKLSAWPLGSPCRRRAPQVQPAREARQDRVHARASTPRIFSMLRRTITCGRPVVDDSLARRSRRASAPRRPAAACPSRSAPPRAAHISISSRVRNAASAPHRPCAPGRRSRRIEADVRLADLDHGLARAVVRHARHVDAAIRRPLPEDRDVEHVSRPLRPPSSGSARTAGRCARRPTDRARTAARARPRRAPGSAA